MIYTSRGVARGDAVEGIALIDQLNCFSSAAYPQRLQFGVGGSPLANRVSPEFGVCVLFYCLFRFILFILIFFEEQPLHRQNATLSLCT